MVGVFIYGGSRPSRQDGSFTNVEHVERPGVRRACERERRLIAVFLRPYKGFWLDSPRGMQDFGV